MGDLRDWSPEPNGATAEDDPSSSSPVTEDRAAAEAAAIGAEYWKRAEDATQGIIAQVQPTVVSEKRRRAVIDFVQRLIKGYLGCEVFPFGSVPLMTYLPDGDIDLTAFGGLNVEEALANDVFSVLEREEKNNAAEFVVKDVQLIRAEVKLVKCLVQNIVVDISFNQLGGLCTLCFLEQVDRFIGKDHLFKQSIILIKAWCYYESRILGAHHGLISTYALETLVLYIFHLFNSSLNGPLAVLYRFLDYFSSFDWDNYCISLNGPVRISSLPELMAETPENGGGELFLPDDFLKGCAEKFSAPSRGYETSSRTFPPKHLNIVDPLKENNNLGRSVSKGNFFRIRSAFSYGARKLRRILSQPEENIGDEIRNFFSNTMERHGKGQRPDVQDAFHMSGYDELGATSFSLDTESEEIQTVHAADSSYSSDITGEPSFQHKGSLNGRVTNVEISEAEGVSDRVVNKTYRGYVNGNAISNNRLKGDATDLASSLPSLTISSDTPNSPTTSGGADRLSTLGKAYHAPHLYIAHSSIANGETNGTDHMKNTEGNGSAEITASDQDEDQLVHNHKSGSPIAPKQQISRMSSIALSSEDFYPSYSVYGSSSAVAGSPEACNTVSDLTGDFESHLSSLQYGRWCYECASTAHVPSMPPMLSPFQSKKSWDVVRRSLQFKQQHLFSQVNTNGIVHGPPFYHINPSLLHGGAGFGVEEMPKARGTGTYFPNMNHYRDRPMTPRGRNQGSLRSPRSNGRLATLNSENGFPEKSSRDAAQASISLHKESGKLVPSDEPYGSPQRKADSNANGAMHLPEHFVEFGSFGRLPPEQPLLRGSWSTNLYSAPVQNLSASLASQETEKLKPPALTLDKDRIAVQSYRLKDEDDFPPLSV